MLVLTRKIGQEIVVGDAVITIQILEVNGKQARIGITAPENISIHRREIFDRIKAAEMKGVHEGINKSS